jgi:hypothetical protein
MVVEDGDRLAKELQFVGKQLDKTGWMTEVRFLQGQGRDLFFLPLLRPDRLWGPPSLLSNGVPGILFPGGKTVEL